MAERNPTPDRLRASIVVPLGGIEPHTIRCLRSVLDAIDACDDPVELVLVMNGVPEADEGELAEIIGHSAVVALRHPRRIGSAPAVVRGIEHASSDLLLFTDADVLVPVDWITRMLDAASSAEVCSASALAANSRRTRVVRLEEHIDIRRNAERTPDGGRAILDFHSMAYRRSLGVMPADDRDNTAHDVEVSIQVMARGLTITSVDDVVVRTYYPETVVAAFRRRNRHGQGAAFIADQWERMGVTLSGTQTPSGYVRDLPRRAREMDLGAIDTCLYVVVQLAYVGCWAFHLRRRRRGRQPGVIASPPDRAAIEEPA